MSVKNVECAWHLVTSQYLILVRLPACNRKKKKILMTYAKEKLWEDQAGCRNRLRKQAQTKQLLEGQASWNQSGSPSRNRSIHISTGHLCCEDDDFLQIHHTLQHLLNSTSKGCKGLTDRPRWSQMPAPELARTEVKGIWPQLLSSSQECTQWHISKRRKEVLIVIVPSQEGMLDNQINK